MNGASYPGWCDLFGNYSQCVRLALLSGCKPSLFIHPPHGPYRWQIKDASSIVHTSRWLLSTEAKSPAPFRLAAHQLAAISFHGKFFYPDKSRRFIKRRRSENKAPINRATENERHSRAHKSSRARWKVQKKNEIPGIFIMCEKYYCTLQSNSAILWCVHLNPPLTIVVVVVVAVVRHFKERSGTREINKRAKIFHPDHIIIP